MTRFVGLIKGTWRKRLRPVLIVGIALFIIVEVIALAPSTLEEGRKSSGMIDPESLVADSAQSLVPGIPKDAIPEYVVEKFDYVSARGTEKQWKLTADTAHLYKSGSEKLIHTQNVRAHIYDPDGKITIVTGKEAKYLSNRRDLEVFGNVRTVFPDGFELKSEYLRYRPNEKTIDIPKKYRTEGIGKESEDGTVLSFLSNGFVYEMKQNKILLPQNVTLTFEKKKLTSNSETKTVIESDRSEIQRIDQVAHFTMEPTRPATMRFVKISQPQTTAKGRKASLRYGSYSEVVEYLTINEDVSVREKRPKGSDRRGTGGLAVFDSKSNTITFTQFPQVYEDQDTVTGDKIVVHRDTDVIEVDQSNAYSEGNKE
ncbi:MAG: LPS export ABC transporter periplasmic protein LptC [Bdellovibrionota bacterium]